MAFATNAKEVELEFLPFVRVYKDGSVERLAGTPYVSPSPADPETGVSSKDISISKNPSISARLFLPKLGQTNRVEEPHKLPILVYFHGGGFLIESAFSFDHHRYLNSLVSEGQVVAVSVEYRLAPENLLPVAYEDCWAALQWVALHSTDNTCIDKDPWLVEHGDFERLYIGGDSSGGNIVHNILMRAGVDKLHGGLRISGALLTHPYFWGSEPVLSETTDKKEREETIPHKVWNFVYPSAPGGVDNPMINPIIHGANSLAGLGCSRMLVTVAEHDLLRDRGISYYNAVKESGWKGDITLIDMEGQGHAFQILNGDSDAAKNFTKNVAKLIFQN